MKPLFLTAIIALVLPLTCVALNDQLKLDALEDLELSQLESRLADIDSRLGELANYSLRSGIGSIGFRSHYHDTSMAEEWIEIDLGQVYPLDEIVMVPTIWRDTKEGFQSDAFPMTFEIWAGTDEERVGTLIKKVETKNSVYPGIAPMVISIEGHTASWVRIKATQLSLRAFDNMYVFQLSELFVFSGEENVALKKPLLTSSNGDDASGAWDNHYLVDGFTPYLMDSAHGEQSIAYVSNQGEYPSLVLDLGKAYLLSKIHMHSVDQSDTVPQAYAGDLGIPRSLIVEGANREDFSDGRVLLEYSRESINDTGPIIIRSLKKMSCRYVRLIPFARENVPPGMHRLGFAEIELFSEGGNIALGKEFTVHPAPKDGVYGRPRSALTDGKNLYGNILPIRQWMQELASRHELETERPLVLEELNLRYARQKARLRMMTRLALVLIVCIGFIILIDRNIRMKQAARIKERFAADLHDELGANLHTLGLLSDLAKDSVDNKDELLELLDRTRVFTERSGMAARYCTNMLEAKGICEDLVDEMERTTRRLLADLKYNLSFEGEDILHNLRPRKRIDLFFFYKEALTNIIKHSGATWVDTRVTATMEEIRLSITDNGHGIINHGLPEKAVPPSLKRRARLFRAKVFLEHPAAGGTRIILKLKNRKLPFLK